MNQQQPPAGRGPKLDPKAPPRTRWWRTYVEVGSPPRKRVALRWGRIAGVIGGLLLFCYLSMATALWGYYSVYRKIPNVHWIDVAVLPRFPRVQQAIAANYFEKAKQAWKDKQYLSAIFTARAAVQKAPSNTDARLFLARCWSEVGRKPEALRVLHDGIAFSASDPRFQEAVIASHLADERYADVLKMLHEEFPAAGVNLIGSGKLVYTLIEIRATLETAGAGAAAALVAAHPEVSDKPEAAALLARIADEQGRGQAALDLLLAARKKSPRDAGIIESYARIAKSLGQDNEAKAAARTYVTLYPSLVPAELCALEMFGSRKGEDVKPWIYEMMVFLKQHHSDPDAMAELSSLAASEGWTDICLVAYENSLQENLTGMPFAVYYAASLVKTGDFAAADGIWRELAQRNGPQISNSSYLQAMIAKGSGRDAEAQEIVASLSRETANDPARRRKLASLFRDFGFPKLAEQLTSGAKA